MNFIPNVRWDFNTPLEQGVGVYGDEDLPVGSLIRLVDLDPTAGHKIVKVTAVRARGYRGVHRSPRCFYYVEESDEFSFQYWYPQEQR